MKRCFLFEGGAQNGYIVVEVYTRLVYTEFRNFCSQVKAFLTLSRYLLFYVSYDSMGNSSLTSTKDSSFLDG